MRDEKKVVTNVNKPVASAGDADPGKEGLDGWTGRHLARPWPILGMGWRIVYASRIPPRPHEA